MQVTFSGIGGRTALVPQKNGVRTPSWAFNSNLKFTCKMTLDAMQDLRVTETPITRALTWEDEQAPANTIGGTPTYTSNATAALVGLTTNPPIVLKTCNGAPGQFKNGFYFTVNSEAHGKCLLIAYLHLGGLLVRPSVKSFNKNNAVLVHTEMCGYDTYSVSVDIKIPETSSIHKAGPRYSSTHPPFCIKYILWGQDGLIKTLHESMPLYSYAKDPDQVNCQYFSPNPSTPLASPSPSRERQPMHRVADSPPSSPTQSLLTGATLTGGAGPTPTSPNTSASPLAALSSSFMMGSAAAAAAISIPMDSFKSLVAYIQKLERQQQQLESARQQEELQHRLISQLAQDIKFKSFQCEVLEEKMQQLSASSPHAQQTPTGDNLIAPSHLINLNPIMPGGSSTVASNHLSPFAYPATPASTSASSTSNALPSFSYPNSNTTHSALTPINDLAVPIASSSTPSPSASTSPLSTPILIANPLTANLPNTPTESNTTTTTTTTTTSTSPLANAINAINASKAEAAPLTTTNTPSPTISTPTASNNTTTSSSSTPPSSSTPAPPSSSPSNNDSAVKENGEVKTTPQNDQSSPSTPSSASSSKDETNGESSDKNAAKAEQQEEEVRDFLTQMQKKQKVSQENSDANTEPERKRTRS